MDKRISVVLCSYNGSAFIKEQLMSILHQTYPIEEIVIVDDHSSDNTCAIIREIATHSTVSIKLLVNEVNIGYNKNFEKAISLAIGDFIAISDQDDVWHADKIKTLLDNWNNTSSLLIYSDTIPFKDIIPEKPQKEKISKRIKGNNPKQLSVYNTISGHTVLFKKELLKYALPFPEDVYYDWWLAIVAMANGGIIHVPKILVYQRVHENNVTIESKTNQSIAWLKDKDKRLLTKQLHHFSKIPNLEKEYATFFAQFNELWYDSKKGRFSFRLFYFLLRNCEHIYAYKVRTFPWISYLKHSYRFAKYRTKNFSENI